ncbi:hypothetical protein OKJ48_42195 [Streptomyces kunmingensis]|uniref:Uncharacterized protein n=1 Tax=Streptomyces kunmingensis TaxID=68225 RepID=A0ABU6CQU7_9ACTN|nr:hypothetical protein [Streptomyces kunmingensis]MEB3966799.1 hypothetical protein [Streptomyces kunmingensis]
MYDTEPYAAAVEVHQPISIEPTAPHRAVELSTERGPVVWVPDAYGRMVPMPKHLAPPPMLRPEPRDLTPQPLLDPVAQRFLGAGIGGGALAAGVGYGVGEAISAVTGAGSGALLWIALIVLACRMPSRTLAARGGSTVNIRKAVIKRNRIYG